jgi:hypothetical protein
VKVWAFLICFYSSFRLLKQIINTNVQKINLTNKSNTNVSPFWQICTLYQMNDWSLNRGKLPLERSVSKILPLSTIFISNTCCSIKIQYLSLLHINTRSSQNSRLNSSVSSVPSHSSSTVDKYEIGIRCSHIERIKNLHVLWISWLKIASFHITYLPAKFIIY